MNYGLSLGLLAKPRIRHVRQTEMAECGLACLAMIASYHGLQVEMSMVRARFAASTRGSTLRSLMDAASRFDLNARAVRLEAKDIDALALPAILHWNLNHYVVLEAVSGSKALIQDPAGPSGWIRLSKLSQHFTGVALELEPTATFEPGDYRQRLRLSKMWTRIRGLKRAVVQTIVLSMVLQFFVLASPYYLQLAIDSVLPELNTGFLTVLAIGFGLFALVNGVAALLRQTVLLAVGSSFGYGLSTNVARRLFRLPLDWFARRHVGDILSRFQSVIPIRKMLAEDAPAVLVDGALAILTLILMFVYSSMLAVIALVALGLFALLQVLLFGARRAAQEEMIIAGGREQSVLIETIQGIGAFRLAAREAVRQAVWQARLTDAVNGAVRNQRIANWQSTLQTTLFALEHIVSIWLAVNLVIRGGFSVGMVFAFVAYKTQFLTAGASLVSKAADFRMLNLHLARLAEIVLAEEDVGFRHHRDTGFELKGKIELRDVRYRYGAGEPAVLDGVDLTVMPGEFVAITGPSGGGKSTLIHILLGMTEPTGGEVLVDDMSLQSFGHRTFQSQVAVVLQQDTLFRGSITDNISLFDENPDDDRVIASARAAAIHDDIRNMPMGYETLVGEMGSNLSGGQRQRILLARALYREPKVLVVDEGTSNLDEALEREVNRAVARLGITRIIVAHRQETIASAGRVLMLEDGRLRELRSADDRAAAAPSD